MAAPRGFQDVARYSDDELWGLVSDARECGDPALGEVVQ